MSIRRQRGYQFEKYLTNWLNSNGWIAKRLGAPTTELPDVFAINNKDGVIAAIECKSTASNRTVVPDYQIQRCVEVVNDFEKYKGIAVLAYKFAGKTKQDGVYHKRKLHYYYFLWDNKLDYMDIACNYEGMLSSHGEPVKLEPYAFSNI